MLLLIKASWAIVYGGFSSEVLPWLTLIMAVLMASWRAANPDLRYLLASQSPRPLGLRHPPRQLSYTHTHHISYPMRNCNYTFRWCLLPIWRVFPFCHLDGLATIILWPTTIKKFPTFCLLSVKCFWTCTYLCNINVTPVAYSVFWWTYLLGLLQGFQKFFTYISALTWEKAGQSSR